MITVQSTDYLIHLDLTKNNEQRRRNYEKININECLNELNIVESSEETMKKINGGCTITVGCCLKDGSYVTFNY